MRASASARGRPPLPSRATLARPSVSSTTTARVAAAADRDGEFAGRIERARERRAAAARQSGEPALGAHQRARRRQQQLGGRGRESRAPRRCRDARSSRPAAARRRPSPRRAGAAPTSPTRRRRRSSSSARAAGSGRRGSRRRGCGPAPAATPVAASSRPRMRCHGAAARSVSMRSSRAPPRGRPRRTPAGPAAAPAARTAPAPARRAARRPLRRAPRTRRVEQARRDRGGGASSTTRRADGSPPGRRRRRRASGSPDVARVGVLLGVAARRRARSRRRSGSLASAGVRRFGRRRVGVVRRAAGEAWRPCASTSRAAIAASLGVDRVAPGERRERRAPRGPRSSGVAQRLDAERDAPRRTAPRRSRRRRATCAGAARGGDRPRATRRRRHAPQSRGSSRCAGRRGTRAARQRRASRLVVVASRRARSTREAAAVAPTPSARSRRRRCRAPPRCAPRSTGRSARPSTAARCRRRPARAARGWSTGAAGSQRRGEIEPAEQPTVVDMQRHGAPSARRRQQRAQRGEPRVAHRTGARLHDDAAEAAPDRSRCSGGEPRVERDWRIGSAASATPAADRGARRDPAQRRPVTSAVVAIRPANTSATARSTRTVEPASSSGLRRSRWRSAGAATRRRCDVVDARVAVERGERARRAHQRQFAAQAIGAELHAQPRRRARAPRRRPRPRRAACARRDDAPTQCARRPSASAR